MEEKIHLTKYGEMMKNTVCHFSWTAYGHVRCNKVYNKKYKSAWELKAELNPIRD